MKRLNLEAKQYLNILIKEERRCFDNWVDKSGNGAAKEKYFEAKKEVWDFKKEYREKGYAI